MINFILVLFVFPESLDKTRMERACKGKGKAKASSSNADAEEEEAEEHQSGFPVSSSSAIQGGHGPQGRRRDETEGEGLISGFLKPLAVFLPVVVLVPSPNGLGRRKKRDWSLTLLAVALLGFMLSSVSYVPASLCELDFDFSSNRDCTRSSTCTLCTPIRGALSSSAIIFRSWEEEGPCFCCLYCLVGVLFGWSVTCGLRLAHINSINQIFQTQASGTHHPGS
jgi:hypothetical protein